MLAENLSDTVIKLSSNKMEIDHSVIAFSTGDSYVNVACSGKKKVIPQYHTADKFDVIRKGNIWKKFTWNHEVVDGQNCYE